MCYIIIMTGTPPADTRSSRNERTGRFVRDWVCANVFNEAACADLPREIDRLACQLTADARLHGISGREIALLVGDIDEFLTGEYMKKPA